MSDAIRKILSRDAGPFWQFVKYGAIGVAATCVNAIVFYAAAGWVVQCLGADDSAVRHFGLPSVEISDAARAFRFCVDNVIGFVFANVFCWFMNRTFVFKPGRHSIIKEFLLFFAVAALAVAIATGASSSLIVSFGMTTSAAFAVEIVVSFLFNFFIRKYFIFKG